MSSQPNIILRGNIKKIDLGTSSYLRIIQNKSLYIDKTKFIAHFLNEPNQVQLIVRQRRLGKSLNLDTLQCFLTDQENNQPLFQGLAIEQSPVFNQCHSAPAFYFDFKNLNLSDYKRQIAKQVFQHLSDYVDVTTLTGALKMNFDSWFNHIESSTEGLLILTELVYHTTGKHSYLLIDEYDNLLTDSYNKPIYEEIRTFLTKLLTAGLKGNRYLKKALMTGVMRVSKESILSGLNNLRVYDLFTDAVYTDDFGLTDPEIDALSQQMPFDKPKLKAWYNGIKINGHSIYNIYAVLSFLQEHKFLNYWGRSGTIEMIIAMMSSDRKTTILKLLNGEMIEVPIAMRISLQELNETSTDSTFYSLLAQTGYVSVEQMNEQYDRAMIKIPNIELMNVWKEFILTQVIKDESLQVLFKHIDDLPQFSLDLQYCLCDRLSFLDLGATKNKEWIYHTFVLGLLSAYYDISLKKFEGVNPASASRFSANRLQSNRESGDGRFDILFERADFSIVFEFKSVADVNELEQALQQGLQQIDVNRYSAELNPHKPLIKTAVAFCGKYCLVDSVMHVWQ